MLNKLVGVPWIPQEWFEPEQTVGITTINTSFKRRWIASKPRTDSKRSVYITRDLIRQYGPTAGCPKCHSVVRGDSINQTLPHSRACLERIEGLVGNDPLSRDRLTRAEERKTRHRGRTP